MVMMMMAMMMMMMMMLSFFNILVYVGGGNGNCGDPGKNGNSIFEDLSNLIAFWKRLGDTSYV